MLSVIATIIALCVAHDLMVIEKRQQVIASLVTCTTAYAVAPAPWRSAATSDAIVARTNTLASIVRDKQEFKFLSKDSRAEIQFDDKNDQFTYTVSTPTPAFLLPHVGLVSETLSASSSRNFQSRSTSVIAQTMP